MRGGGDELSAMNMGKKNGLEVEETKTAKDREKETVSHIVPPPNCPPFTYPSHHTPIPLLLLQSFHFLFLLVNKQTILFICIEFRESTDEGV